MVHGRVIPFLGAGVNLCGRPNGVAWKPGALLPSGAELARHLAASFDHPARPYYDLVSVSQYVATMNGSGPLYEELRRLFDVDYEPNIVHNLLANLPKILRAKAYVPRYPLILTTNYDDALEHSFDIAKEPFDLVRYMADGESRGKFFHSPADEEPIIIERPNEYRGLSLDLRTVILKIHGAIDRVDAERDSYVITEDHYIDYLTRTDISNLVPVSLAAKLRRSHFLFLGYSLRDWNLRVILHRIWGQQRLTYKSWAIQLDPDPLEQEYWVKRDVNIIQAPLEEYIATLIEQIEALPPAVADE